MRQNNQKIEAQKFSKGSKQHLSQSFGSKKSASVLNQFKLKTKQVLIDDLKMRKLYQSLKPIPHGYKTELKDFIKQLTSKPKDEFIELAYFLVDKFIDLTNLKIYLWYFGEGKSTGNWEQAWPFCALLDSFSQSVLSEESHNEWTKSVKSQDTNRSKPSVVTEEQSDPFEDFYMSPIPKKLQRFQSVPLNHDSKKLEASKETKDIMRPIQKMIECLSSGNLVEACKQQFPEPLSSRIKSKMGKFWEEAQVIKRVIEYLNGSVLILDKVKPEVDLKSLQNCMQKIGKLKSRSQKNDKPIKYSETVNTQGGLSESVQSVEDLSFALSEARRLFNEKSGEYSREMNYKKEMAEKMTGLERQKIELSDTIMDLKVQIESKGKQMQILREDYLNRLKNTINGHEIVVKELNRQIEAKSEKIKYLEKQREQSLKFSLEKSNNEHEEVTRLKALIEKLKDDINSLNNQLNQSYTREVQLKQQNRKLTETIKSRQAQEIESFEAQKSKLSVLQQRQTLLSNKNQQLQQQITGLTTALKQANSAVSVQSQISQTLSKAILYFTKINSLLESSDILPPLSEKTLTESLFKDKSFLSESDSQKRSQILAQKKLTSILQKQYLVDQLQSFVGHLGSNLKVQSFKLIYRLHHDIKNNFHQFIDGRANFLVLVKLKTGAVIGGYSHQPLKKGTRTQLGFLFSLSLMETYFLREKYCLIYDDYYLIFGNSQIRIRIGQSVFYSNFGISKSHFEVHDRKFTDFLMVQTEREQLIEHFEIYQVIYDYD